MDLGPLARLTIVPEEPSQMWKELGKDGFTVQFNPTSYSVDKSVSWTEHVVTETNAQGEGVQRRNRVVDAPPMDFGGGAPRRLIVDLFFDVTGDGPEADVRVHTNNLVRLTRLDRSLTPQTPPICNISWGKSNAQEQTKWDDLPMRCVLTALTQEFLMFRANGVPVRAKLRATFTEHIKVEQNKQETDPDLTTYVVKRGDTFSSIAALHYNDAARWRVITVANGIDDPRRVVPGQRLTIPRQT